MSEDTVKRSIAIVVSAALFAWGATGVWTQHIAIGGRFGVKSVTQLVDMPAVAAGFLLIAMSAKVMTLIVRAPRYTYFANGFLLMTAIATAIAVLFLANSSANTG